MPNYRELYIELYRATEKAIALLREAQESLKPSIWRSLIRNLTGAVFPIQWKKKRRIASSLRQNGGSILKLLSV